MTRTDDHNDPMRPPASMDQTSISLDFFKPMKDHQTRMMIKSQIKTLTPEEALAMVNSNGAMFKEMRSEILNKRFNIVGEDGKQFKFSKLGGQWSLVPAEYFQRESCSNKTILEKLREISLVVNNIDVIVEKIDELKYEVDKIERKLGIEPEPFFKNTRFSRLGKL